jgi:hypothetical protein
MDANWVPRLVGMFVSKLYLTLSHSDRGGNQKGQGKDRNAHIIMLHDEMGDGISYSCLNKQEFEQPVESAANPATRKNVIMH